MLAVQLTFITSFRWWDNALIAMTCVVEAHLCSSILWLSVFPTVCFYLAVEKIKKQENPVYGMFLILSSLRWLCLSFNGREILQPKQLTWYPSRCGGSANAGRAPEYNFTTYINRFFALFVFWTQSDIHVLVFFSSPNARLSSGFSALCWPSIADLAPKVSDRCFCRCFTTPKWLFVLAARISVSFTFVLFWKSSQA